MIEVKATMRLSHAEMTQNCIKQYLSSLYKNMPFKTGDITFDRIDGVLYLPEYTTVVVHGVAPDSLVLGDKMPEYKCQSCMEGAPYSYCCRLECGEHEFCRGCNISKKPIPSECKGD